MLVPFTLVTEFHKPVAIILDENPSPRQLTTLFALLPENAVSDPELAQRWNAAHVLCPRAWAQEQHRRRPMFKPVGSRMAFLASVFLLAIGNLLSAIAQIPALPMKPALASASLSSLPSVVPVTNYFTATAVSATGLESDYSNEIKLVTTNTLIPFACTWSPLTNHASRITYRIYQGPSPRTYIYMADAGTNAQWTVLPRTNRLWTVHIQSAPSPQGPWTRLPSPICLTNPVGARYFRAGITLTNF